LARAPDWPDEAGIFGLLQAKVVLHVSRETLGALAGAGNVVEQRPQRLVQVGDAVDLQAASDAAGRSGHRGCRPAGCSG
jgi:hypothetical protein